MFKVRRVGREVAALRYGSAIMILLAFWWFVANTLSVDSIAGPIEVASLMVGEYYQSGKGRTVLFTTLQWTTASWLAGLLAAGVFSSAGRLSGLIATIWEVLFSALRSLPSVIAIPVFAIVFGFDRTGTFACAIALTCAYAFPSLDGSLRSAATRRDKLRECLRFSRTQETLVVTLPGIGEALGGVALNSFGIAMVVSIAGEMILSLPGTVGESVGTLAWLLRTSEMYAMVGWLVIASTILASLAHSAPTLLTVPGRILVDLKLGHFNYQDSLDFVE